MINSNLIKNAEFLNKHNSKPNLKLGSFADMNQTHSDIVLEIDKKGTKPRPLSPHLQIYKWQLTSLMSIGHRASGIALSLGSILIVTWLVTLASGPELFSIASLVISHWFGQFILFGFSVVLFYHLLNGIRNLSWDIGYGFNLSIVYKTGYAVLFTALFLTIVTWLTVWFF
jgi:succinate dehydrogenase / fumarate reductase cytochrome b subunit